MQQSSFDLSAYFREDQRGMEFMFCNLVAVLCCKLVIQILLLKKYYSDWIL